MPTFIGFNTINQYKKFTLTDFELIKRDLANAFNIQQGQIPGRPGYGTNLWAYVFETQTPEVQDAMLAECQRVIAGDPRLHLSDAYVYPQDNGILIELQVQVVPSTNVQRLELFFDSNSRTATLS